MTVPKSQPHSFSIRPAQLSDSRPIADLGAHVFSVTFGHSVQPHELDAFLQESYTEAAVRKDILDADKDVIIATDAEDKILGFAYLTRGSSEPCVDEMENKVELQRIYVHPSAHGKGVGRALAVKVEDMARAQGFKNIWLGVWEENVKAMRAYEKWGYERVGDHDFVIGSVVQTDYIMLKAL
ncbi:hypothetical protein ACJ41O_007181 [Fusarium nematophilum]